MIGCVTLIGTFLTGATLDAQESQDRRQVHSQTQQGITVRLEKVTLERIFNASAWIKAEQEKPNAGKQAFKSFLEQSLPAKFCTFYVSVVGETKTLGPTKIKFTGEVETVASVLRFFSPPKWQPRLPKLAVDPTASGIESQHLLDGNTQISDVFPSQIEVQVTDANGKELTFVFENVEF